MKTFGCSVLMAMFVSSLFCIPFFFKTGKIIINCEAIEPAWVNCEAKQSHFLGLKPRGEASTIERVQTISIEERGGSSDDDLYKADYSVVIQGRQAQQLEYSTFVRAETEAKLLRQFLQQTQESSTHKSFEVVIDDRWIISTYWVGGIFIMMIVFGSAAIFSQNKDLE